ncbi:hypothetical protein EIO_0461 [Ketogulonicigenium vulgare Y25]|uniref:Uncharacterized protein n=1 Tax=Ketogulonicigenium vulgare (strain WSH-001) TaxID=759362 RepID=F9Y7P5_KETVW|nr:hypothetical protein EIO_0461 [Ketogulonicigenium vulgare Y25]AEM39861.1 hypothetical protein KVU_0022 [Ketogulonicigenium vulgare WSH-001]ALJ80080.1 hypothetical protein KVH_02145 [Ketogulonicigenium vulgare]ANW34870.1 hypothetical protein KvSKV_02145 [Ketogulonicigenium vulgare]
MFLHDLLLYPIGHAPPGWISCATGYIHLSIRICGAFCAGRRTAGKADRNQRLHHRRDLTGIGRILSK